MITADSLDSAIRGCWPTIAPGERVPRRLAYILLTKGVEEGSKLVLLVFLDGNAAPRLAVKLGRTPAQNASLEAERRNLEALADRGDNGQVGAPVVLGSSWIDGRLILMQLPVEGRNLLELAAASRSTMYVRLVVDWLIHLARATRHVAAEKALSDRRLAGPDAPEPGRLLRDLPRESLPSPLSILNELRGESIPAVFEQRDLSTWNILVGADGRLTVLDWESASPAGIPVWDLFYFLLQYGFMVHRAAGPQAQLRSFSDTFATRTGFGAIAHEAVARYIGAVGVRREWLSPLLAACWAHHAYGEASRRRVRASDTLFGQLVEATLRLEQEGRLEWPRAA